MIERHGRPPVAGVRYRRRPGIYAILIDGRGRVLLTEQRTPEIREIQLPGGGIDRGELPGPALAREVLEETGYSCQLLRRLGAYRRFAWMGEYGFHAEKVCHVYLARPGLRLGPPREGDHRAVWASCPRAAADLVASPGDRAMLLRVARRRSRT